MAAPTRWEPGPPATTSTTSTDNSQISALTCTFGPPKHFPSTGYLSPCKTSSNASTTPCSLDIASQIPRPNAARRIAAKTSRPRRLSTKSSHASCPMSNSPPFPDSAHRSRTRQAPTSSRFQPFSAAPSPFPLLVAILTYRHIMEQPTTAGRSKRQEPSPCLTADAWRRQSSHPTSTF